MSHQGEGVCQRGGFVFFIQSALVCPDKPGEDLHLTKLAKVPFCSRYFLYGDLEYQTVSENI